MGTFTSTFFVPLTTTPGGADRTSLPRCIPSAATPMKKREPARKGQLRPCQPGGRLRKGSGQTAAPGENAPASAGQLQHRRDRWGREAD